MDPYFHMIIVEQPLVCNNLFLKYVFGRFHETLFLNHSMDLIMAMVQEIFRVSLRGLNPSTKISRDGA